MYQIAQRALEPPSIPLITADIKQERQVNRALEPKAQWLHDKPRAGHASTTQTASRGSIQTLGSAFIIRYVSPGPRTA